jgi:protein-tyrosine phosphatase
MTADTPVAISRITETLFLGCSVVARNRGMLLQHRVGAVINCAQECANHHQDTFCYLQFMLDDHGGENITTVFREATEFIDENAARGICTLVHCAAGRSRSVTVVIAYLMRSRGMPLLEAARHVKRVRPWVKPNSGFLRSLCLYERTLRGHRSTSPEELEGMFRR